MRKATITALLFVLFLQGCAFQSFLFDTEEARAGFVITRPPVQISYRGDVSKESQAFALNMLHEMQSEKTNDYKFNENTNARLNSIDGKSDNINVILHEATTETKDKDGDENPYEDKYKGE